jgi:hypothetical protein
MRLFLAEIDTETEWADVFLSKSRDVQSIIPAARKDWASTAVEPAKPRMI